MRVSTNVSWVVTRLGWRPKDLGLLLMVVLIGVGGLWGWGCAGSRPAMVQSPPPVVDDTPLLEAEQEYRTQNIALYNAIDNLQFALDSLAQALDQRLQGIEAQLAAIRDTRQEIAAPVVPQTTPSESSSVAPSWPLNGVEALYQQALEQYRQRRYREAMAGFIQVLTHGQGTGYDDNAQYWIGECYYGLGQYEAALPAFERVLQFPGTNKAADSRFKIGLCYKQLGQNDQARRELERFIRDYPDHPNVARARNELQILP